MKKNYLIFMSFVLAFLFGANSAWAQTTIFDFEITGTDTYTVSGGTVSYKGTIENKTPGWGLKLDGEASSKYLTITLSNETLKAGDKITVTEYATSNPSGSDYGVALKVGDNTTDGLFIPAKVKNTFYDGVYEVTAGDLLIGQNEFNVIRAANASTYVHGVTITREKTVDTETTELTGVTINDEPIASTALAELLANKTVSLTNSYTLTPAVVFNTKTTTTYEDNTSDVTTGTVNATVTEVGNTFVATAEVGAETYNVIVKKDLSAVLEVAPANITLKSVTIGTGKATVTVNGANLTGDEVTITLPAVAGLTCTPTSLPITDGSVSGEIIFSYKSVEDVAEANANVVLAAGETKANIEVTYSSTAAITTVVPVSEATTWDWTNANQSNIQLTEGNGRNEDIVLSNFPGWVESFPADAIIGNGEYMSRDKKYFQGGSLKFETTVPGTVTVYFCNTGNRDENKGLERNVSINGMPVPGDGSITTKTYTEGACNVNAGEVVIKGYMVADGTDQYVRISKVVFTPAQMVSISEAGFCSFAPTMDVEIPEGVQAWALESTADIVGDVMTLTEVTGSIEANKGVILTGAKGDYGFVPTTGASTSSILLGAGAEGVHLNEGEAYILGAKEGNPCFCLCGTGTLGAYKAYLPKASMKAPVLRISFGGATTAIENVEVEATIADSAAYNVLGQKVTDSYKGLVIKNGKKTVVK